MTSYSLRNIEDLQRRHHACCVSTTEEECMTMLTPYLRLGLERGERVIYSTVTSDTETILQNLRDDGLELDRYLTSGQLTVAAPATNNQGHSVLSPEEMIDRLRREEDCALAEGYPGLCVTVETTQMLQGPAGFEGILRYEAALNRFLPGSRCSVLCHYDRRHCPPDLLRRALTTHPLVYVGGMIYDLHPGTARHLPGPWRRRLSVTKQATSSTAGS